MGLESCTALPLEVRGTSRTKSPQRRWGLFTSWMTSLALAYNAGMEHQRLTVQNVKDLQDGGKRWLENVLGQHLKESQQVFIMVFTPSIEPDEATRRQALASVQQITIQVENNLTEQGVTSDDFDAAADEAMDDVRRRES